MRIPRRAFLGGILGTLTGVSVLALLRPSMARAADWPKDAFSAKTVDDALRHLYGSATPTPSPKIKLQAPFHANDGARITVNISTTLKDVQTISLLVDKNPQPLAAHITTRDIAAFFSTNIKLATTSEVRCIVKAGDKLYSAKQTIKVSAGGYE